MLSTANVLPRRSRPTQKSYRAAVKKIVLDLQHEFSLNDPELADRLGCSSGTIKNARNEATNIDGVTLANIEHEFGPAALDPFLALGGSRSVPITDEVPAGINPTLTIAQALALIIGTQHPNSEAGMETTAREAARILPALIDGRTAMDALIALAEGRSLRAVA